MSNETRQLLLFYIEAASSPQYQGVDLAEYQDRMFQLKHPDYYASVNEIQIDGVVNTANDNYSINCTAIVPKEQNDSAPIFLYFHGGAFVAGRYVEYRPSLVQLVAVLKIRIVYVHYRLAPENVYPIGLNDCIEATKNVLERKLELFPNSQLAKVGVMGSSAGGNFAAIVANTLTKSFIDYQVLIYPPVALTPNHTTGGTFDEFKDPMYLQIQDMETSTYLYVLPAVQQYGEAVMFFPQFSPLFGVTSNTPKALIIGGELELFRDQYYLYDAVLKQNNVESTLLIVPGAVHSFAQVPFYFVDAVQMIIDAIKICIEN